MPIQDTLMMPQMPTMAVVLAPAQSALFSLFLLTKGDHLSGLSEWVTETTARLTPEERHRNRLIIFGLHYATIPEEVWPSFPAYLEHLRTCDPVILRDKMLDTYARLRVTKDHTEHVPQDEVAMDYDAVLRDAGSYLAFLRSRYPEDLIDEELEAEAFTYAADPPVMQTLIVDHLRHMWNTYLEAEWHRVAPMLRDAVRAFQQIDLNGMDRLEAARLITGLDLDEEHWRGVSARARQMLFLPSAHVGPYMRKFWTRHETFWVIFGARLPEGSQFHAPDLSRTEIVVRLNALADDTRLRILRLLVEHEELSSQDVMSALGLSQSAASRHLKQLSATGYVTERRCNGAKCYRLNPRRVEDTLRALSAFLLQK